MNWIRVVYLYLFASVGLVLLTVGGAQLIGLGLRTYVLTEADAESRLWYAPAPPGRVSVDRADVPADDGTLDEPTREALRAWAEEYQRITEAREDIDPVRSARQRDLAGALALLLIGFPLFLYHWRTIRVERAGMTSVGGGVRDSA